MKNYNKFIFLFFCACLTGFGSSLFAQTDYIINNDGVKIMGEVKSNNYNKVKFIPDGEKKVQKFNPKQLKESYKAGEGVFRSVVRSKGEAPLFLKVLEDGRVKLYEYFRQSAGGYTGGAAGGAGGYFVGGSTQKRWYAQKDEGVLVDIKSNGIWGSRKDRKDNFLNLVTDNAHVTERYKKVDKFNFDFVRSLIVEYNTLKAKEEGK